MVADALPPWVVNDPRSQGISSQPYSGDLFNGKCSVYILEAQCNGNIDAAIAHIEINDVVGTIMEHHSYMLPEMASVPILLHQLGNITRKTHCSNHYVMRTYITSSVNILAIFDALPHPVVSLKSLPGWAWCKLSFSSRQPWYWLSVSFQL